MNNKLSFLLLVLSALLITACSDKKESSVIITHKHVVKPSNKVLSMGDFEQKREVEWLGATYTVDVSFKSDPSLPKVKEDNQLYYDSRITVVVKRKDGSEFFRRQFTKSDFASYVSDYYVDNGALTGIVFDKVEDGKLVFAASVGSPDKSSDEYIPLMMTLSRTGDLKITKYSEMDTSSDVVPEELDDEDGV